MPKHTFLLRMRCIYGLGYEFEPITICDDVLIRCQANIMLAYPIDEAEELLDSKLTAAKQNLANCEEDLDFLREQITVKST